MTDWIPYVIYALSSELHFGTNVLWKVWFIAKLLLELDGQGEMQSGKTLTRFLWTNAIWYGKSVELNGLGSFDLIVASDCIPT